MKALFTGLFNVFESDQVVGTIYDDMAGKLYLDEAPQAASLPFVVYRETSQSADWNFTSTFEDFTIEFSIYCDTSRSDLEDYREHLMTLFDNTFPTVTGYTVVMMNRGQSAVEVEEDFWECSIEYDITMQKN